MAERSAGSWQKKTRPCVDGLGREDESSCLEVDAAMVRTRDSFLQLQLQPDRGALILAGLAAAALGAGDTGVLLLEYLLGAGHVAQAIALAQMSIGFFGHERTGDGFHDRLLPDRL